MPMKIVIDKNGPHIHVELVTDASKKPIVLDVAQDQFKALLALLETARKADRFKFTWEAS